MKEHLKNKLNGWLRSRKIARETPEIWLLESIGVGYIQIPKVATRSIQQSLAACYVETEGLEKPSAWSKKKIRDIEKKTAFHATHKKLSHIRDSHYLFAFVRNPYDRLYSAYKNKVLESPGEGKRNIFWNHGVHFGMEFAEFIEVVCEIPDEKIDRHLRSQSWFLTFEDQLIPHFIGKLEKFETDWDVLNDRFKLAEVMHKNSTKVLSLHGGYQSQYTKHLEEKVFNRYRKDFEQFSYVRMKI